MTRDAPEPGGDLRPLTTCPTHQEAALIRYALSMRQIPSSIRERRGMPIVGRGDGRIEILVHESALERAREALPYIAGAMFGESLALDAEGRCALCGYDMRGVPHTTICPECGEDLASISAKRRAGLRP